MALLCGQQHMEFQVVRKIATALLFIIALFASAVPALAQFSDQQTGAGSGGGTANAQTFTLAGLINYNQILWVKISFVPANANTGAATITPTGDNGALGTIAIRKFTDSGLAALTGGELQAGQPIVVMYDGTSFDIISGQYVKTTSSTLANSALGFNAAINASLSSSVGSNQLTVTLGSIGSGPIIIPFRDPTVANGDPIIRANGSSLTMTVNSGNTMGCQSGVMCRLWILVIDNGGTLGLCLYNANLSGNSVLSIEEGNVQSSASGTNGGSSAQTLYCGISSVSAKAVRYIGYIEIQESTAGTWASGASLMQLMGPGVHKPGDIIRTFVLNNATPNGSVGATVTITGLTTSVSPLSAANLFLVRAHGTGNGSGNGNNTNLRVARSNASTAPSNLFGNTGTAECAFNGSGSMAVITTMVAEGMDQPNTTNSTPYSAYVFGAGGAWLPTLSGTSPSGEMVIQEIMGALEPANDNAEPLRMVG